jgi:hypothetical protein
MKGFKLYIIAGILFVSVLGTLLHFAYEWSGNNFLVGLFTPVNESVWEHTKLIFFPMLLYSLWQSKKIANEYPSISSAMAAGALLGILLIITLFYTYSGILGYTFDFLNILTFFLSVIAAFYYVCRSAARSYEKYENLLTILLLAVTSLYVIFTLYPPEIALFISPQ